VSRLRSAIFLAVIAAALAPPGPAEATFPGKNGKIAFDRFDPAQRRFEITTMNADGTGVTSLELEGTQPAWSADGSKIAFSAGSSGQGQGISIANSDGTGLIKLTEGAADDRHPTWSPDGKWIAFARYEEETDYQLYIIGTDGKDLRRVRPSGLEWALDPDWSPDGSKIAFFGPGKHPGYIVDYPDIYTVRPDGAGLAKVTDDPGDDEDSAWSPDGSRIAFVSLRDSSYEARWHIYSVAADGTGVTRLSFGDANEIEPAWSPDGTKIAFTVYGDVFPRPFGYNIYTMNPDGSARTALTTSGGDEDPDWQPIPAPRRSDYRNAAQFCKAEQAFWGDQFASRYGGGPNAYGKCVSQSH
jgi:TolB protein